MTPASQHKVLLPPPTLIKSGLGGGSRPGSPWMPPHPSSQVSVTTQPTLTSGPRPAYLCFSDPRSLEVWSVTGPTQFRDRRLQGDVWLPWASRFRLRPQILSPGPWGAMGDGQLGGDRRVHCIHRTGYSLQWLLSMC